MIKQADKDKLKVLFLGLAAFLTSYIGRINLAVPLLLTALYIYFKFRRFNLKNFSFLNLVLLFLLIFYSACYITSRGGPVFYIPFSLVPMLATLLFGSLEISLVVTLGLSVAIASVSGNFFQVALLSLISGIFASILVSGARKRSTIIRSGAIVGVLQAVSIILMENFAISLPERYLGFLLNGIASSIIVLGVLPIFEYLFKSVTNVSLLELADFNHPLLQRLTLEAPGTYHHSLVVGNLSESACAAVGANALLARIGAYYHDIGKLHKPDYYSENQDITKSRHDTLSPTMSKLIIMNHVKEGVELAKKYRLNSLLVDFIMQHHGNGLVFYFYRRALEGLEENHEVKEEGFRYPGPKPDTKETAIVLLADSVEAATRALVDPSPAKIEELVHKVINNKFIDGQLDKCDLTLKDLERISAVFIRILGGMYHSRVSYSEEARSETDHKKFPKEDPRLSEEDNKHNP